MLLSAVDLHSGYGDVRVLHGVSIEVGEKESVALLGPNGAGKTTLLKTLIGQLKATSGDLFFKGERTNSMKPASLLRMGIVLVPEGSTVFPYMTVEENLEMGAYVVGDRNLIDEKIRNVYGMFPELKERRSNKAITLSGGERTMLALARGLIPNPLLLLVDEPSLGLDPKHLELAFRKLKELTETGISILIAEQNARRALELTERAYVLESGKVRLSGHSKELMTRDDIRRAYLGAAITSNDNLRTASRRQRR